MASPLHIRDLATRLKVGIVADAIVKYPSCQPGNTIERLERQLVDSLLSTVWSAAINRRIKVDTTTSEYTKMWGKVSDFCNINNWDEMSDSRLNKCLYSLRDLGGTLLKKVTIKNLGDEILSVPVTPNQIAESEQKWIDNGYIDYEENRAEKIDGAIDWMNRIRNVGKTSRFAKGAANLWQ